mmetsp:Transcript_26352/g.39923  ORF Transcript_26352/g.39923 Transcript_26352/m.39923 type:complete len:744 (+) Transcript_26352:1702-3933(+)
MRRLLFLVLLLVIISCSHVVESQRSLVSLRAKLKTLSGTTSQDASNDEASAGGKKKKKKNQEEDEIAEFDHWIFKNDWKKPFHIFITCVMGAFLITVLCITECDDNDEASTKAVETEAQKETDKTVELSFEGIHITLQNKKDGERTLMDGSTIHGMARPGELLAIMGPSGAGKSILLEAIGGQLPSNSKLSKVEGNVYLNGIRTNDSRNNHNVVLIPQESDFFPHMTVYETLEFRAKLLLRKKSKSEMQQHLNKILKQLNLFHVKDTIVGNQKVRGLSGGERKRLSIAVKLVQDPPAVLLLDEPTSGLDSYQAKQVVESLKKLAKEETHKTIVAVIHQPSQHIFSQFDNVLALAEGGRQVYFGPTSEVRSYLQEQSTNTKVSKEIGTAELLLECVSKVNANGGPEELASLEQIEKLVIKGKESKTRIPLRTKPVPTPDPITSNTYARRNKRLRRANVLTQFRLLLQRSLREIFRSKTTIIIKVVQQVMLGLIYGSIYKLNTNNQASVQDRLGLLSLIAIGSMNMGLAGTIRSFPKEKSIVTKEIASAKLYATGPYFLAKAVSEIPMLGIFNAIFTTIIFSLTKLQRSQFRNFLGIVSLHTILSEAAGLLIGALAPNSDIALALFPPIAVLNIIFDGKNLSMDNTPTYLQWLPKLSLIRWGFEGLAVTEFTGLRFLPGRRGGFSTGEEVLDRYGMLETSVQDVAQVQTLLIGVCWLASYLALAATRQRFMTMQAPGVATKSKKD